METVRIIFQCFGAPAISNSGLVLLLVGFLAYRSLYGRQV